MYKNVKEKMHFILHLMIHLTVQSRGAPEGTLEGAPNDALSNLHKDAQEGAFEVALNPIQDGGGAKRPPLPVFPLQLLQTYDLTPKLSGFYS